MSDPIRPEIATATLLHWMAALSETLVAKGVLTPADIHKTANRAIDLTKGGEAESRALMKTIFSNLPDK